PRGRAGLAGASTRCDARSRVGAAWAGAAGWAAGRLAWVCWRAFMRRMKRSIWPAVSTTRCSPVKNGWHFEQTSTRRLGLVEALCQLLPQLQVIVAGPYFGWI